MRFRADSAKAQVSTLTEARNSQRCNAHIDSPPAFINTTSARPQTTSQFRPASSAVPASTSYRRRLEAWAKRLIAAVRGLRIGEEGVAFNHHFVSPKEPACGS
jgi:hypothetical protein